MHSERASRPLLSAVFATYGQPKVWDLQWEQLRMLPLYFAAKMELVIVDDHGSPVATIPKDIRDRFPCKLFRVDENIAWNQMGARNLGMQEASAKVAVMLDPDMVPTPLVWDKIMWAAENLHEGTVVKFSLTGSDGGFIHSSPNTWILHTSDFFSIHGYDEDYAGNKGWSDVALMHTLNSAFKIERRPDILVPYLLNTDGVEDAQVTSLDRSVQVNAKKHKAIWHEIQRRYGGNWAKWAKKKKKPVVRFPWTRIL